MNNMFRHAPIIGFVRYSQKIVFRDTEKDVFEPSYFEYRFNIFKKVTLKCFQQQTNKNFVLVLLHSENMPEHYKKRFINLEKENDFLYNIFIQDNQKCFQETLGKSIQHVSFVNETAITFRIDNDDAVPIDFIENLSGFLREDFVDFTISMPMMYVIKRIEGKLYLVQEYYFPANAIGLASVTHRDTYKTIIELGEHDTLNKNNKMILLPTSSSGGIMTINGENAINTIDRERATKKTEEELKTYLREKGFENIDLDCLRVFSQQDHVYKPLLKRALKLFTPPFIILIIQKVRNRFK